MFLDGRDDAASRRGSPAPDEVVVPLGAQDRRSRARDEEHVMTEHTTDTPSASARERTPEAYPAATGASGWVGWAMFAGTMMVLIGSLHIVQGLVGVFDDDYFLVSDDGLVVSIDYTVWGWTHLVAGVLVVVAGFGVFTGKTWARVVGVALALVSAVVNFGFMASYPFWSATVIALDVFVILALTVHGDELRRAQGVQTRVPRQHAP